MSSPALPLSTIVDVVVQVAAQSAVAPIFNQGLIIGPSTAISGTTRLKQYVSLATMLTDGFTTSNPEYIAAQLLTSQSPAPTTWWIGRQDLTASETCLQAVQKCRAASSAWWAVMVTDAVKADHEAIAAYVESMQPVGAYFYTTADADVLAGTVGNVGQALSAASYKRDFGVYATTQGGAAPNNIYACAAAMGVMMGLNTGLANSFFTMKFKQLVGTFPEPLTFSQITTIEQQNINLYEGYANAYTILEQGQTPTTGTFIDQVLNRDILTAAIQYSVMNLLVASPAVPQTDPGQTQLIHAVNQACQQSVDRGYLAGGTWNGPQVLNLSPGDPMPDGYKVDSPPYSKQSTADHLARKSQPIYAAVIEAGAVHSVLIGVYIQP